MQTQEELNVDVLRLLLEFAGSSSRSSALALSLVSHEVQSWMDPHLFKCIIQTEKTSAFHDGALCKESQLLRNMAHTNASPRLVRARAYIRAIGWKIWGNFYPIIEECLPLFPNVEQVCFWNLIFPTRGDIDFTRIYPSLRRICTCVDERLPSRTFSEPFWSTVSHLHLRCVLQLSADDSPFREPIFEGMPSLTHLIVDCSLLSRAKYVDRILTGSQASLTSPPNLKLCILGLRLVREEAITRELESARREVLDERIVLWSEEWEPWSDIIFPKSTDEDRILDLWSSVQFERKTLWDMGEEVLSERQRLMSK
ncbi:hypothetical protein DL96DRAFT_886473 [Flagelloscypha sp. PMI_526]|nr:hypothetical protein DL96DRAFT_886473 [Flagelloscypha sp. PMI_526]